MRFRKNIKKVLFISVIVIAVGSYVSWYVWHFEHREEMLEVYFFDLKKGNAVFVRTPHGKTVLFGAGESNEIIKKLTEVIPIYRRRVDAIYLWGNEKNNTGVIDVLNRYDVGMIVTQSSFELATTASSSISSAPFSLISNLASAKGVSTVADKVTDKNGADIDGVSIQFIKKTSATTTSTVDALKITYGNNKFLLVGDLSKKDQATLNSNTNLNAEDLRAQVIFLNSATTARVDLAFFNAVNPRFVVLPKLPSRPKSAVSKKSFDLYSIKNIKVFSLGKEGTVSFVSDGNVVREGGR